MAPASIYGWSLLFAAACLVVLTIGMGCVPIRQEDSPFLRGDTVDACPCRDGPHVIIHGCPRLPRPGRQATGEPRYTTRLTLEPVVAAQGHRTGIHGRDVNWLDFHSYHSTEIALCLPVLQITKAPAL